VHPRERSECEPVGKKSLRQDAGGERVTCGGRRRAGCVGGRAGGAQAGEVASPKNGRVPRYAPGVPTDSVLRYGMSRTRVICPPWTSQTKMAVFVLSPGIPVAVSCHTTMSP
jgi:hypothetical protein